MLPPASAPPADSTPPDAPTSVIAPATTAATQPIAAHALFYGWVMLPIAMLTLIASSPGQTFGFAYFNPHFQQALSLSSTQLSTIYLYATLLAAVPLSYCGALTDRFGLRNSLLVAIGVMSACCVLLSSATNVVTLFICFLLMRLFGPGMLVLLANNTLAAWFDRRLGMAIGAMQLSMAAAMSLVPARFIVLIAALGWRQAYVAIGCGLTLVMVPLIWFCYRQSPAELGQWPDGRRQHPTDRQPILPGQPTFQQASEPADASFTLQQAMQTPAYWILNTATAAWAMIATGIIFHVTAVFAAQGYDQTISKFALTPLAIGMASMQLTGGLLADRISIRWLAMAAMAGFATGCLLLTVATTSFALLAAYAVFGLSQGLMSVIAGTGWARFFGRTHLGKIRGASLTVAVAASSIGPLLMSLSVDYLGSFTPSLWLFATIALAVSSAGYWAIKPPAVTQS